MTAIRSDMVSASDWSWVTYSTVTPVRSWMCLISYCICSRSCLSSAPSGSSIRTSLGSNTSARATATRCCWPPESWAGRRCPKPESWTMSSARLIRAAISALGSFLTSSGKARFSATVMCGNRA